MKVTLFFSSACAAALALTFSSCSNQKATSADGYETATAASGEIPPWMAENSDPTYESGKYTPVTENSAASSSYAYNPPSKPSVKSSRSSSSVKSSNQRSSSKAKSSNKKGKSSASSNKKKKSTKARSYSVKKGDTLGAIARKNGTSVSALKRANGLKSDMIHINQKLTIPRK